MNNKVDAKIICLARLSFIATILAWVVIGLGAYTRLTNAGLGCPDWPGCYGHFTVPHSQTLIQKNNRAFANTPLVKSKAWAEMVHRYFAGTLGLLVIVIALLAALAANQYGFHYLLFAMFLFALIIFQAALGMLTVTLKLLPLIVSLHLIGGMTILGILWLVYLKSHNKVTTGKLTATYSLRPWATLGLILVILQIALGAWTSTNYAALSCPSFPYCHAHWAQRFDFQHAFNLISPIGVNYEGGQLNNIARETIHMTHRFGALIVSCYLLGFIIWIQMKKQFHTLKKISYFIAIILIVQISLGILNVLLKLPLTIAVSHNLLAALLLLSLVSINFIIFRKGSKVNESND